jgi:O-antigen/teichoic acid export membrane protein
MNRIVTLLKSFVNARSSSTAVIKNVAIRVALLGINFCTGVIVARSLGPTGRGEQAAIGLWPSLIATLATLGIPTALNFHSRRRPEDARRLYMGSAVLMLIVGLVGSAVGAAAMPLLLHDFDSRTIRTAQWFMLFAPETLVASVARAHLESQNQFTRSTLSFFYPVVATLISLVLLRLVDHLTPMTAALSYVFPPAVQAVWIISRLWKPKLFRLRQLIPDITLLLPYGLQCYGIDIISSLAVQLDLVIIVSFLSPAQLGLYTVALSLSRVINVVHSSVVTVLFSRASELSTDHAIELVGRAARLTTVICIALGAALYLVANIVVPVVYGPDFSAVLPVLGILIGETVLGGLVIVHFQAFMSTGRPAFVTIIEASWTATAFALLLLLVPRMNLTGAATALLLAAVVRLTCVILAYPIILKRPIPNMIIEASDFAYVRDKFLRLRVEPRTLSTEQPAQ